MLDSDRVKKLRTGKADHKGGYWTAQDKEDLKRMFNEQAGITEMALHFQRTELAIMNQLLKLGVYERVRDTHMVKQGCLCSQCSIRDKCKGKGPLCNR